MNGVKMMNGVKTMNGVKSMIGVKTMNGFKTAQPMPLQIKHLPPLRIDHFGD
jgi:hypothetical protein